MFSIQIIHDISDTDNIFKMNIRFIENNQESQHSYFQYHPIKGLYYLEVVKYFKWVKFIASDNGNVTHITDI